MRTVAVIPTAGAGIRMGSDRPKQFLDLCGRPLLAFTLEPFQKCGMVDAIILVVPPDSVDYCRKEIVERFGLDKVRDVVPGGKRRQDSVRLGIEAGGGNYDHVLIHDGVRPLIDEPFIRRVLKAARIHRAVISALPARETVKEIDHEGAVLKTHGRERIRLVQTPQVFRYEDIKTAHERALEEGWEGATDDALLMEKMGIPVKVVEGLEKNIKVTTPYDLELARFLLGRAHS